MKFVVKYKVVGFDGEQQAGPYLSLSEAVSQRTDIAGYEGVYDVILVDVPDEAAPETSP